MTEPWLVGLLQELVELESPSGSAGARAVASRLAEELERLGAETSLLEGNHLRAELPGRGTPILLSGHVDTVWPEGTLAEMPFRVEGDRAFGPGVYDMKASLVELVEAIRRVGPDRHPLRVLLTADEEKGSRSGREPLEEAARGVAAAVRRRASDAGGKAEDRAQGARLLHAHDLGARRPCGHRAPQGCQRDRGAGSPDPGVARPQ